MPNPDINLVYHLNSLPKEKLIEEFAKAKQIIDYTKKYDSEYSKKINTNNEKNWYDPYIWWWWWY